jgi:hypothetical protein
LKRLQVTANALEWLILARRSELRDLKQREAVVMKTLGTLAEKRSDCLKKIARMHADGHGLMRT